VAYLEGWYVAPRARRRAVGTALVRAAEAWGRARGCTEFGSDVLIDNEISASAHEALGFDETSRVVNFRKPLAGLLLIGAVSTVSGFARQGHPVVLQGIVRDSATHEPLAGAMALVEGSSLRIAADESGRFRIVIALDTGQHRLRVQYIGYSPERRPFTVAQRDTIDFGVIELAQRPVQVDDFVVNTPIVPTLPGDVRLRIRASGIDSTRWLSGTIMLDAERCITVMLDRVAREGNRLVVRENVRPDERVPASLRVVLEMAEAGTRNVDLTWLREQQPTSCR
jgi:hypothetical protein